VAKLEEVCSLFTKLTLLGKRDKNLITKKKVQNEKKKYAD
jgi:hypothetical protein